jgi:hypothetical protein
MSSTSASALFRLAFDEENLEALIFLAAWSSISRRNRSPGVTSPLQLPPASAISAAAGGSR